MASYMLFTMIDAINLNKILHMWKNNDECTCFYMALIQMSLKCIRFWIATWWQCLALVQPTLLFKTLSG